MVCALLLVVFGVIYEALDNVVQAETYATDRTDSLDSMRLGLNEMTRELRQAAGVDDTSTASQIDFETYSSGAAEHVTYRAVGTTLTRQAGANAPVPVLQGLASTSVFTYVTAPPVPGAQWVRINLQVRPKRTPDTVLVLDSEVNLRNRTEASS
jgi:hypothetical protein